MYDIHNHVLPGIDDGPREWESAVNMLRQSVNEGVKGIVVTPHITPGRYESTKQRISSVTEELGRRARGLPIELFPGSEIMLSAETAAGILNGLYFTINSGRYVLIELPENFSRQAVLDIIFRLTSKELIPVIAHPERNFKIRSNINILYEIINMGAVGQMDGGSITGYFGVDIKKAAADILSRRLVQIMATDAHSDTERVPLSAAAKEVEKLLGKRLAKTMISDLPHKIIKNEIFNIPEPVYPKKGFFMFRNN